MRVGTNKVANQLYATSTANLNKLTKTAERLATGKAAARGDGKGFYAVGMGLKARAMAGKAGIKSLTSTLARTSLSESLLEKTQENLARMIELATLATDANLTTNDLTALNGEFLRLGTELDNYGSNTIKLNGSNVFETTISVNFGQDSTDVLTLSAVVLSVTGSLVTALSISTSASAVLALATLQLAVGSVGIASGVASNNTSRINTAIEAVSAANALFENAASTLIDADIAQEMTAFASQQILVAGANAVLAQANSTTQDALRFYNGL